jgi:hypothetical protein
MLDFRLSVAVLRGYAHFKNLVFVFCHLQETRHNSIAIKCYSGQRPGNADHFALTPPTGLCAQ